MSHWLLRGLRLRFNLGSLGFGLLWIGLAEFLDPLLISLSHLVILGSRLLHKGNPDPVSLTYLSCRLLLLLLLRLLWLRLCFLLLFGLELVGLELSKELLLQSLVFLTFQAPQVLLSGDCLLDNFLFGRCLGDIGKELVCNQVALLVCHP